MTVEARNSAGKRSDKLPPVAFPQIIKAQGPERGRHVQPG
jgi:hypothetical protein